ncbi:MAG: hypothetical protein ACTHZ5_03140 [Micrococcaceae bacterium]
MMRSSSLRTSLFGGTAVLALLLTGCSTDSEPAGFTEADSSDSTQRADQTAEPTDNTGASDDVSVSNSHEESSPGQSEQSLIDPEAAIETVTYPIDSRDVEGTMTVGLHHLKVRENSMELLLTYTPEFEASGEYNLWELHSRNHSMVAPALYDRENLKRYDILRNSALWDSPGVWGSPNAQVDLASGETQAYWANFAPPQDDIDTINVALPNAPEFEDVQIAQDGSGADTATDASSEDAASEDDS